MKVEIGIEGVIRSEHHGLGWQKGGKKAKLG
jgi:hypothetical protein